MDRSTEEVTSALHKAKSINELGRQLAQQDNKHPHPIDYLEKLLNDRGIKFSEVIAAASINDSYGRHLHRKSRKLNRNNIIKIALSAKFNIEETNNILKYANCRPLYAKDDRDKVIIWCLEQKINVTETNMNLDTLAQELL